jgi:hypothetical protein
MRRVLVVVGLVVLLAAAIVVPAVAQASPAGNNALDRFLQALGVASGTEEAGEVLSDLFGARNANDVVIPPIARDSEENPSVSSSDSSDPNNAISSTSNTSDPNIVDPNGSNSDPVVSQEFSERRIQSGSASPSSSFSNTGDNVNACPTTQQVVNTGNVANEQGVTQYNSAADDVDLTGSSITVDSSVSAGCTQSIDQAAAAGK